MSDDVKNSVPEDSEAADVDSTDHRCVTDFTQVASVAQGGEYVPGMERRRQSLRAKLERERFERKKEIMSNPLIATFLNLFGASRQ
jgi:hypothetical protein